MKPKSWTIKTLLKVTTDYLNKKQIEGARLNAEVLLAHLLDIDRIALYLNFDQPLTESEISAYRLLIKRRVRREPLQYITGVQEFWSLNFIVNTQVLIPRPETELLVQLTVELINVPGAFENNSPKILDLGTGCGALAISLAKELQEVHVWATDISRGALDLTFLNAKKHGVSDRINLVQGDLFNPLFNQEITFDIIVSNPPYIATEEYSSLSPEIRYHEPRLALDGQKNGLSCIERIITDGPAFLNPGGWILVEMAPGQTEKALVLMEQIDWYGEKSRIKDYSHRYRVVKAQKVKNDIHEP